MLESIWNVENQKLKFLDSEKIIKVPIIVHVVYGFDLPVTFSQNGCWVP